MPRQLTQGELLVIFNALKPLLSVYEGKFKATFDLQTRYELWSYGDFEIAGRKRKEVFFAGLILQSNYVGFYFMPIYADENLKAFFQPELLKCLKGKSCFHIKIADDQLLQQIVDALEKGFELYKERGWVSN